MTFFANSSTIDPFDGRSKELSVLVMDLSMPTLLNGLASQLNYYPVFICRIFLTQGDSFNAQNK